MLSDFWKYNGYNGVPLYFINLKLLFLMKLKKNKNVENNP